MKRDYNVIDVLKELADKFGYNLEKRRVVDNEEEIFASLNTEYSKLPSDRLLTLLKDIEINESKLIQKELHLVESVNKFMKDVPPNDLTQGLYNGKNFMSNKVNVINLERTQLHSLKNFVTKKLKQAIGREFKDKFLALNPNFKDLLNEIYVEDAAMGQRLNIVLEYEDSLPKKGQTEVNNGVRGQTDKTDGEVSSNTQNPKG